MKRVDPDSVCGGRSEEEEEGLLAGDLLLSFNGQSLRGLDHGQCAAVLSGPTQGEVVVNVLRHTGGHSDHSKEGLTGGQHQEQEEELVNAGRSSLKDWSSKDSDYQSAESLVDHDSDPDHHQHHRNASPAGHRPNQNQVFARSQLRLGYRHSFRSGSTGGRTRKDDEEVEGVHDGSLNGTGHSNADDAIDIGTELGAPGATTRTLTATVHSNLYEEDPIHSDMDLTNQIPAPFMDEQLTTHSHDSTIEVTDLVIHPAPPEFQSELSPPPSPGDSPPPPLPTGPPPPLPPGPPPNSLPPSISDLGDSTDEELQNLKSDADMNSMEDASYSLSDAPMAAGVARWRNEDGAEVDSPPPPPLPACPPPGSAHATEGAALVEATEDRWTTGTNETSPPTQLSLQKKPKELPSQPPNTLDVRPTSPARRPNFIVTNPEIHIDYSSHSFMSNDMTFSDSLGSAELGSADTTTGEMNSFEDVPVTDIDSILDEDSPLDMNHGILVDTEVTLTRLPMTTRRYTNDGSFIPPPPIDPSQLPITIEESDPVPHANQPNSLIELEETAEKTTQRLHLQSNSFDPFEEIENTLTSLSANNDLQLPSEPEPKAMGLFDSKDGSVTVPSTCDLVESTLGNERSLIPLESELPSLPSQNEIEHANTFSEIHTRPIPSEAQPVASQSDVDLLTLSFRDDSVIKHSEDNSGDLQERHDLSLRREDIIAPSTDNILDLSPPYMGLSPEEIAVNVHEDELIAFDPPPVPTMPSPIATNTQNELLSVSAQEELIVTPTTLDETEIHLDFGGGLQEASESFPSQNVLDLSELSNSGIELSESCVTTSSNQNDETFDLLVQTQEHSEVNAFVQPQDVTQGQPGQLEELSFLESPPPAPDTSQFALVDEQFLPPAELTPDLRQLPVGGAEGWVSDHLGQQEGALPSLPPSPPHSPPPPLPLTPAPAFADSDEEHVEEVSRKDNESKLLPQPVLEGDSFSTSRGIDNQTLATDNQLAVVGDQAIDNVNASAYGTAAREWIARRESGSLLSRSFSDGVKQASEPDPGGRDGSGSNERGNEGDTPTASGLSGDVLAVGVHVDEAPRSDTLTSDQGGSAGGSSPLSDGPDTLPAPMESDPTALTAMAEHLSVHVVTDALGVISMSDTTLKSPPAIPNTSTPGQTSIAEKTSVVETTSNWPPAMTGNLELDSAQGGAAPEANPPEVPPLLDSLSFSPPPPVPNVINLPPPPPPPTSALPDTLGLAPVGSPVAARSVTVAEDVVNSNDQPCATPATSSRPRSPPTATTTSPEKEGPGSSTSTSPPVTMTTTASSLHRDAASTGPWDASSRRLLPSPAPAPSSPQRPQRPPSPSRLLPTIRPASPLPASPGKATSSPTKLLQGGTTTGTSRLGRVSSSSSTSSMVRVRNRRSDTEPFQVEVLKGILGVGLEVEMTDEGQARVTGLSPTGPVARNGHIR